MLTLASVIGAIRDAGLMDDGYLYIPFNGSQTNNGSWRIGLDGDTFIIQRLDAGVWVTYDQKGT